MISVFNISKVVLSYCLAFLPLFINGQSQLDFINTSSIVSDFEMDDGVSPAKASSQNNEIVYYKEGQGGLLFIEKIFFDTTHKSFSKSRFQIANPEDEPFCNDIALKDDMLFVFGQEVISKFKIIGGQYVLLDSLNVLKRNITNAFYDKIFIVDSNRVLLASQYPYNIDFEFKLLLIDFENKEIIKEKRIKIGKNIILNYESIISSYDFYNDKILLSLPATNEIYEYNLDFELIRKNEIPFYLETNISDSLDKYISDIFIKQYIYSPKATIEIMSKNKGKGIFYMQQIRSQKYINDSIICIVVNTHKMNFIKENLIYFLNIINNEISYSIEDIGIDYWSPDLMQAYNRGIKINDNDFFIISREVFDDSTNTLVLQYNIYKRNGIGSFVDNSIRLNNKTFFLYDFKRQPVKINAVDYEYFVLFDEYNCKNCVLDKKAKVLFISTQMVDKISNYKLRQEYKTEYPNSSLYFIQPKFYNIEGIENKLIKIE